MGGTAKRARRLRRDSTFPERLLWSKLRNRQMSGWKFRRQHPIGPYFADFVCSEAMLVIEIDGDTHGSDAQIARDQRRTRFMESEGWTVHRFWNADLTENVDGILWQIEDILKSISARPD